MRRVVAGLFLTTAMWGAGREVVLFDTDSCLFCDDGAALALLLRRPSPVLVPGLPLVPGNVHVPGNASSSAEFNFWFDPEAARIVLRSRIPQKVMFGLDICNTAPVRKRHFEELIAVKTPITDLIREDWGNGYPGFFKHPEGVAYLWDVLAAAYLLDPGFVTKWETSHLDVLTVWGKFYGSTVPLDRKAAPNATPVKVAVQL